MKYLRNILDLKKGSDEEQTIEDIRNNVEFKGSNLWVLIFSIFIASIGLNINSAAVIIGAMLISPLMGPILGLGLAVAINDFELLLISLKNLLIAVFISVLTSTIYFLISPLSDAQSELLARTTPTIFDVFIALFGGLAGMVGTSRKFRGNVIPGVAIATALMPPLCTAGYGLATMQFNYFFGAFYLFFINSVFISLSTLLIASLLNFKHKVIIDEIKRKRTTRFITIFVILTILPSIYLAYKVVRESYTKRNVNNYLNENFQFENSSVINKNIEFYDDSCKIEVTILGNIINDNKIKELKRILPKYNLKKASLFVYQQKDFTLDLEKKYKNNINPNLIEKLYKKNEIIIADKENKIKLLENELLKYKSSNYDLLQLNKEILFAFPEIKEFTMSNLMYYNRENQKIDTLPTALIKSNKLNKRNFENWIKQRLSLDTIKLIQNF